MTFLLLNAKNIWVIIRKNFEYFTFHLYLFLLVIAVQQKFSFAKRCMTQKNFDRE